MRSAIVFLGATIALVSAQVNSTCCGITPGSVDINTRLSWCRAQRNTCPELCSNGQTSSNTCDENTLNYNCACSTGNTPNVSDYAQTLPSLQCDEWKSQCIAAHPNDLAGQNFCLSFVCGSKNATTGSRSVSTSSSASSSGSRTASATGSTSPTSSSSAATMLAAGRQYGTGAVLLAVSGLFALAL